MKTFELTEQHLKLMKKLHFRWSDDVYDGAPCVDIKRPYGNSHACSRDVPELLGMKPVYIDNEYQYTDDQIAEAEKIHRQMATVLQICCSTLSFESGTYQMTDPYNCLSWKRIT